MTMTAKKDVQIKTIDAEREAVEREIKQIVEMEVDRLYVVPA